LINYWRSPRCVS